MILSDIYHYFYPRKETENEVQLYLGAAAQDHLKEQAKAELPHLTFNPLPSNFSEDSHLAIGSSRFKVIPIKEGKPCSIGFEVGVVILMRSSTHLGVARLIHDIQPLKQALQEMHSSSQQKIELFIVDGKSSDTTIYDDAQRFIRCFNQRHGPLAFVSADLFGLAEFESSTGSQTPGVQFAGFNRDSQPVVIIDCV